jgi:SAM-dependent methyltransferase
MTATAHSSGYSNELYDTIAAFGLRRGAKILDAGSSNGIASQPFAANGFSVTVSPSVETLACPDERFAVVLAADVFHEIDRAKALDEVHRVLRPAGIVAIWWKQPMGGTSSRGFREFYAAEGFVDQTLRVIPWRTMATINEAPVPLAFIQYLYLAKKR